MAPWSRPDDAVLYGAVPVHVSMAGRHGGAGAVH
jgi:hypothetical protein